MTEDLQSLLEKINRDGVEKAEAEAKRIVDAAKAEASSIIGSAREEAAKATAASEQAAKDYAARANETIAQASRDVLLKIGASVTAMLEKLLVQDVNAALTNDAVAIVGEAIRNLAGNVEIAAPEKLAAALKAQFAAQPNITVITDPTMNSGFSVKTDGGRVEHAFTGEVIAEELAKRLRPELAKLLK